jgi:hypothetical protein
VELLTLDPKIFDNLQDFFTKYKDLLLQFKACIVDKSKEEKQMVLTILSKLGPKFSMFESTFHLVEFSSGATWKMPSLEEFIESLTQEQTKLINMRKSKSQRRMHLLCKIEMVINIINLKIKTKGKLMQIRRRKGTQNPSTMPPDPKVEREEKGRNAHTAIKDSIQNPHVCKKR